MKITRLAKGIAYLVATVLVACISVAMQAAMHTEGGLEENYFRSDGVLFLIAATVLGVGVYSWLSYTRRHREHRMDSLFLVATGGTLMLLTVFVVVYYGGMEGSFDESGHTAVNLNIAAVFRAAAAIFSPGGGAGRGRPAGRIPPEGPACSSPAAWWRWRW